jgi:2,5-furandicarboxylate decarboxylase 1
VAAGRKGSLKMADCERFRLRNFLDRLHTEGQLETQTGPVAIADVSQILAASDKAVLFEDVGGAALAGNVMASRARMASAFGVTPTELRGEILRRLETPPTLVEIPRAQAPVQQCVETGDEIDLSRLPVHLQHTLDGGPYISGAIDFSHNPRRGWTNVGLRRLLLRGRRETGIDLTAPSDLRTIYQSSLANGEAVPLSIVVGAHPIDYFAGAMRLPVDELGLIASLRDAPLAVVKSITNDIRVPADAEWVIEGVLDPAGYQETEGPFGEILGYYGGVKLNPVFHVTAVTHRRDAVFQTVTISGRHLAATDSAQIIALRTEVLVWQALKLAVRQPVAVYAPPATGGYLNVRIAMRQTVPGEARNAIAAVFGSLANAKNVFVVDPDIDIFSDEQMEWALATRFQPARDLVVMAGFRTSPLDPSLAGMHSGTKAGYDLTMPAGLDGLESLVPEAVGAGSQIFASPRAALQAGPRSFAELVDSLASRDGREMALMLDAMRDAGEIRRDTSDGRYALNSGSNA